MNVSANYSKIPASSKIHETARIKCSTFVLGENCYIGPNVTITCNHFVAGDYLYIPGNVDIGRGGCNGPNSNVTIGSGVGIFEGVVINPSENVTIGDDVGIGAESLLWTHGAWLNVLDGFPASFESVSIGSHVWLPARSILLPGCKIGDNCVIGTGSIITKDIPSGSLAMGSPCKVVRENAYPIVLATSSKVKIINEILDIWKNDLLPHKGINSRFVDVSCNVEDDQITINLEYKNKMTFDINSMTHSELDDVGEDLRDFMRRRGIKFFTGKPFKSIPPMYEREL